MTSVFMLKSTLLVTHLCLLLSLHRTSVSRLIAHCKAVAENRPHLTLKIVVVISDTGPAVEP